jgi:uncharacterized protein (DUF362 family)
MVYMLIFRKQGVTLPFFRRKDMPYKASITRYSENNQSIKKAIELSGTFDTIKPGDRIFVKPNIVLWTMKAVFPKWGVITTSNVIEEIVSYLSDLSVGSIVICEGIITFKEGDLETPQHAFESLGYNKLKERYGVEVLNIFDRPFDRVKVHDRLNLWVNRDARESDVIVDVPVLKTHAQAKVSLSMKNLKGLLNIASRKKCHSEDMSHPLDYWISTLPGIFPPIVSVIDGIYTLEKGPALDGKARRSDIIIASNDILTADMVGAMILGHEPSSVPHIALAAKEAGRPADLSDTEILGEPVDSLSSYHEYDFPYTEDERQHMKMDKMGIEGLTYRKFDSTLCTYCSIVNGAIITSIMAAWKGEPWDNVEILTGKIMEPEPGNNKTVLLGQCMCSKHRDNPAIKEAIEIPGCPPDPEKAAEALQEAGIDVNPAIFQNIEPGLGFMMQKYKDKPEFKEDFFKL